MPSRLHQIKRFYTCLPRTLSTELTQAVDLTGARVARLVKDDHPRRAGDRNRANEWYDRDIVGFDRHRDNGAGILRHASAISRRPDHRYANWNVRCVDTPQVVLDLRLRRRRIARRTIGKWFYRF